MGQRERKLIGGSIVGVVGTLAVLLMLGLRTPHLMHQHTATARKMPAAMKALTGVVVVLDPGHGGADSGAMSGPISEAALSYRTACELAVCLKNAGAEVVYTVHSRRLDPALAVAEPPLLRPTDAVLAINGQPLRLRHSPRPLWQRAAAARAVWMQRCGRDSLARRNVFFISLHYDQFHARTVHGGVVCVDRRIRLLPALSLALAQQMVSGNLARSGDFRGVRGLAGRQLGVLDPDYNPVPEKVLVELATLSNPENAAEAGDPVWRDEIARRITAAVTQVHQLPAAAEKIASAR